LENFEHEIVKEVCDEIEEKEIIIDDELKGKAQEFLY